MIAEVPALQCPMYSIPDEILTFRGTSEAPNLMGFGNMHDLRQAMVVRDGSGEAARPVGGTRRRRTRRSAADFSSPPEVGRGGIRGWPDGGGNWRFWSSSSARASTAWTAEPEQHGSAALKELLLDLCDMRWAAGADAPEAVLRASEYKVRSRRARAREYREAGKVEIR